MARATRNGEAVGQVHVALDVRVLQQALINSPHGGLGGPGRYAYQLLDELRRHDDVECTLLLHHGPVPSRLAELVSATKRFRLRRVGLGGWLPQHLVNGRATPLVAAMEAAPLDRRIRSLRPEVVHIVDQPPPRLRTRPRIVTLHDLGPFGGGANEVGTAAPGALARSGLAAVRSADVVVCVSEATRADAVRVLGVAPDRLEVVLPGVEGRRFSPGPTEGIRRELGLPERARYFLHVGVLRERKNPDGLLRAFRELADAHEELRLVCAGPYQTSPEASRRVTALAARLGIGSRVHLAVDLDDQALVRAYRGSLGLVFPSLYEGFGFPVVEALSCGVPVVAGDNSSLPEVGGDLAVLVDARDHAAIAAGMARVLDDEPLGAKVRALGPEWARRFSWRAAVDRFHDLYLELSERRT